MSCNNKIISITTENPVYLKYIVDILKEFLNDVKIDIIRPSILPKKTQNTIEEEKPNKIKKSKKHVSKSDEESDEKLKKEKKSKKNISNSDDESVEKIKKNKNKSKKNKNKEISDSKHSSDSEHTVESENEKKVNKETKNDTIDKNAGGLKIIALDPHKSLLVYIKLKHENFSEFYCLHNMYSFGLDLAQLQKFMKTIDKDSVMNISIDNDKPQEVIFNLKNDTTETDKEYIQKVLDTDDEVQPIPKDCNFDMTVVMNTSEFRKICFEMYQFADYIEIRCSNTELSFRCKGDQSGLTAKYKDSDKENGIRIYCLKENTKSVITQGIFSLKTLTPFGKCVAMSEKTQIFLKNNYPAFIQFKVGVLGKMLAGFTPVDDGSFPNNNYDDDDEYYPKQKVIMKKT
jgi:proliferating cell nuclear antigen PCNA